MCERTIVLDNGSGSIYAGYAEEDNPISVFPNLSAVGSNSGNKRKVNFVDFSESEKYTQFLNDLKNREFKANYSIDHGIITNWDSMEAVWDYTFSQALGQNPQEFNLFITEATMNPKPNREKMAQILFEKFNFPAIYISQSAILSLYSAGLTTGVVLDCGDGVVQTVPVWGGYPITDAMNRADIGGRDVTTLLGKLLRDKGISAKPFEVIQLLKESAGLVSEDAKKLPQSETTFQLPDGEKIKLGEERYRCSELLFDPSLMGENDKQGVHEMLYKSIMKTNMDIRKDLYGNIVLSGGSTLFPGFVERLTKEVAALVPSKAKLRIIAKPERKYATWSGGSVLASLSNFSRLLISKQEFEDVGPSIMHKK